MPANTATTGTNRPNTRRTVPRVTAQGSIQLVEAAAPRAGPVTRAASATNTTTGNRAGNAPTTRAAARAGTSGIPAPRAGVARTGSQNTTRANTTATRSTATTTRPTTIARPGATTRAMAAASTTSTADTRTNAPSTRTTARLTQPPPPPSATAQMMRTPSGPRTRSTALLRSSSHNSNYGLGRTSSNASLMLLPPPPAFPGLQAPPMFTGLPTPPSFAMIPATPTRRPRDSDGVGATPMSVGSGDDSGAFLRVGSLPVPPLLQTGGQQGRQSTGRQSTGNVSLETSFGDPEATPSWARNVVEGSPVPATPSNPREKRAARVAARAAAARERESTPQPMDAAAVLAAIEAGEPVVMAEPTVQDVSAGLESLSVEDPVAGSSEESGAESAGASTVGSVALRQGKAKAKKKAKGKGKKKSKVMTFTLGPVPEDTTTREAAAQPAHGIKRERDTDEPKPAPRTVHTIEGVLAARARITPEESRANAEDILRKMKYLHESGAWAPDRAHARKRGYTSVPAYATTPSGIPWSSQCIPSTGLI
ncbi:unnamed protein product [Peniophora sp. CBMAI 1063]|nr:unnamed protein product [Peniophora sp. CBMAI 1063]